MALIGRPEMAQYQIYINNCRLSASPTLYLENGDQVSICSTDDETYLLLGLDGVFAGAPAQITVSPCTNFVTYYTVNGAPGPHGYKIVCLAAGTENDLLISVPPPIIIE
jgi:hypothetical protein